MYKNLSLKQIADSGQVFRFNEIADGRFEVIAGDKRLVISDGDRITDPFWKHYFDLETDYANFIKAVSPDDKFLSEAAAFAEGVRILNQDPWEMLISFIISQRKSIPAIRTSIEKLSARFGSRKKKEEGGFYYAFPTPKQLAGASIEELRECSLGYRAEYIAAAASDVYRGELDLCAFSKLSDDDLRAELMKLKGVGIKVANCVMLFGYHRIGAFPVDVWIQRIEDRYYEGRFPVEQYDGFAGVLQQYMFFYIKNLALLDKN